LKKDRVISRSKAEVQAKAMAIENQDEDFI
jgi:hypothetical protein